MSFQVKELVEYFGDDKKTLSQASARLLDTVEQLSRLVNGCEVKNGDAWTMIPEQQFFDKAAARFRHLATMLAAFSQSLPTRLQWRPPVVEVEHLSQNTGNGGGNQEEPQGVLSKLISVPKRVASIAATYLAPPMLEQLDPHEVQFGVNSLQAEFTRLQIMAQEGWLDARMCREELAEKVGQLIGWIHADTWGKVTDQILEIDRISANVLKEQ